MVDSPRRHFLPWDRPLLPQAVAWLARDWTGAGPLDLGDTLVVVPTRQSGRRLREALAAHAAAHGQAVFPPRVVTPETLIVSGPVEGTASRLESLLAWTEVFRELDLGDFRAVFPIDPPARNFAWALRLAQDFVRLQGSLAEAGLRLADVPVRAGENFSEAERWQQIAGLERLHTAQLARRDLRDAPAAEIAQARAPVLPEGVTRIVVLAAPDPRSLARSALEVHARAVPVEVVVFAPETEAAAFDAWGRPLADVWTQREFALTEFERHVTLCADPGAQAERVIAVARSYDRAEGVMAAGVADADVSPLLETGLRQAGLAGFNPEGRARQGDALYQLLAALATLARDDAFGTVAALARCPDFLEFIGRRGGGRMSAAEFLAGLDRLHAAHLPADLAAARRHAPGNAGLAAMVELRAMLRTGVFPENAATALGAIFAARQFDLARPADALAAEAAETWSEVMREVRGAAAKFDGVTDAEWWEVALRIYGESVRTDEKPTGALELQGWLELLWEDAPHLVIAGLNDGAVPEAVVGDPFLPESLRERLGLKTNAARFARDAYLLQALAACREQGGRLDLLLGKTSVAGDPLRPSRLLLRCADAELPQRIAFLFGAVEAGRATPAWRRAWQLQAPSFAEATEGRPRVAPPARVAVTALRAWLECPFRFYLARVLRMEAVDPAKTELDALDFGTLCHAALEAMGQEPAMRDCTDAKALREFLLAALDREATRRFGAELTLPLLVQLESARQRLSRAADVQAQTRADGWVIEWVERKFELEVGGLVVSGKIDRLDRHEHTGALRVLDYKTSDRPVSPWEAHLRPARRDETAPEFARWATGDDREQVWRDLQLPLYLRAMEVERVVPNAPGGESVLGTTRPTCSAGYFNLPKAATETGIAAWDGYTPELAESAWRCVEGVAAAIRAGEFWPPNENVRADNDEFAALFHHGAAESVEFFGSAGGPPTVLLESGRAARAPGVEAP